MGGKRRSGLANDRRAYGCYNCIPSTYTVTYNGNTNTSGNSPKDSSTYVSGSSVTVLGNSGTIALLKPGYIFSGWNTEANGSGTSYSQGNTFTINTYKILYAKWVLESLPSAPIPLSNAEVPDSSVGGNKSAYILFTQSGTVTNYEYSTDDGVTFLPFVPPQTYSPVNITTLSSDGLTKLENGTQYTVKLKAVNSGGTSNESVSFIVTPIETYLSSSDRLIYLNANDTVSYTGSGSEWKNIDSPTTYTATLNNSPIFNDSTRNPPNKYFDFNTVTSDQFAQITQTSDINPIVHRPFTIQMWVKINNVGVEEGTLVNKMFFPGNGFDGYNFTYTADNALQLHLNGRSQDNRFKSVKGVLTSEWALYTANIKFGNQNVGSNRIYVNGREVLGPTISNETGIQNNNQNMKFPGGFAGDGKCYIGQFYYYTKYLTIPEIIQNFDATKTPYL